jgi:hypothetical protein
MNLLMGKKQDGETPDSGSNIYTVKPKLVIRESVKNIS